MWHRYQIITAALCSVYGKVVSKPTVMFYTKMCAKYNVGILRPKHSREYNYTSKPYRLVSIF